jgi:hypothetical protein
MSRQPQTLCAIHHYLCAIASLLCVQSPAYRVVDLQSVKDYPSSLTGKARKSLGNGKLFGVRETTPPAATRDLPITLRTKSRWIASPRSGSSAASPQTVPGVGRHPQRSSLLGLGRARRTSCSSARHGVRGQEAGRRRMSMPVAACVLKISGAQPQPLHIGDKDAGPRNPLISPGMPSTCSGEENWSKKDQCG